MKIDFSGKALALLVGASVAAMVAASAAQAKTELVFVHGTMQGGKLVASKVLTHDLPTASSRKGKVVKYYFSYDYSASVAADTLTPITGWGLYSTTTCMGLTAGKMKVTTKGKYGKFSTSVTPVTGDTTSDCPSGITDFSTANLLYLWKIKSAKTGTTDTGVGLWSSGDISGFEFIITNNVTITYAP